MQKDAEVGRIAMAVPVIICILPVCSCPQTQQLLSMLQPQMFSSTEPLFRGLKLYLPGNHVCIYYSVSKLCLQCFPFTYWT